MPSQKGHPHTKVSDSGVNQQTGKALPSVTHSSLSVSICSHCDLVLRVEGAGVPFYMDPSVPYARLVCQHMKPAG
jgi:hypothetical protein